MTLTVTVEVPKGHTARVTLIDHPVREGEPVQETRTSEDLEAGAKKTFHPHATQSILVEEYTGDPRLGQAPDPVVGAAEAPAADAEDKK